MRRVYSTCPRTQLGRPLGLFWCDVGTLRATAIHAGARADPCDDVERRGHERRWSAALASVVARTA
jgi:hypothetical protein